MSARFSATTAKLMDALSKAQSEIVNPKKTETAEVYSKRTNGKYSYRFSTLDQVIEAIKEPSAKHNIAYTQPLLISEKGVGCTTRLSCGDEFLEFDVELPCDADIQAMGSAFTYARRYSLLAAFGIAPEEDDDGKAAMPKRTEQLAAEQPDKKPRPANGKPIVGTKEYNQLVRNPIGKMLDHDDFKAAWPNGPDEFKAWVSSNKVAGFSSWQAVEQCDDIKRLAELKTLIDLETARRAIEAQQPA